MRIDPLGEGNQTNKPQEFAFIFRGLLRSIDSRACFWIYIFNFPAAILLRGIALLIRKL